jgi:hypothetical protein
MSNSRDKIFKASDWLFLPTKGGIVNFAVKKITGKTPLGWAYHGAKTLSENMNLISLYEQGIRTAEDYEWNTLYKKIPGYKRNPNGIWYDEQAARDAKRGICTNATERIYSPDHNKNNYVKTSDFAKRYERFAKHREYCAKTADDRERLLNKLQHAGIKPDRKTQEYIKCTYPQRTPTRSINKSLAAKVRMGASGHSRPFENQSHPLKNAPYLNPLPQSSASSINKSLAAKVRMEASGHSRPFENQSHPLKNAPYL